MEEVQEGRKQKSPPTAGQQQSTETPKKQKICSGTGKIVGFRGQLSAAPLKEVFEYTIYPYPEEFSLPKLALVCKSWQVVTRKPSLWMQTIKIRFPRVFFSKLSLIREREDEAKHSKSTADKMNIQGEEMSPGPTFGEEDTFREEEEEMEEDDDSSDDEKFEVEKSLEDIPPPTQEEMLKIQKLEDIVVTVKLLLQQVGEYKQTRALIEEMRQKGNASFKEDKIEDALRFYATGFQAAEKLVCGAEDLSAPLEERIEMRHLLAIVYSNASAAEFKLKRFERAAKWAVRARERLISIHCLLKGKDEFMKRFGELEKKVKNRIRQALTHVIPRISLVRHSAIPVEGVGVGTLLRSNRDMGGSIFDDSTVLLFEHERDEGCRGLVLNKSATLSNGETRRMGGPVHPRERVYLHNVADLPDAKRIIDGVYFGGDIEEARRREGARVESFYGFAAWFQGQLDGEIRNEDWTWTNDASADLVFPAEEESKTSNCENSNGESSHGKDEKV
eukprot:CAMPEP_0114505620 /NCGR_PEP_ID=MMETSP0109-20121206/10956_1 /TAXON_ID=29199 /ORGANISM="Chlorarachnion reptans, Strain CCCM449" /LENGTH=502 /DNA_ID=CAMNT_0001684083 /DNA_START=206 /DNA_END=1714 /DNA_ORIENTATION=+